MSIKKTPEDLKNHKSNSISTLDAYLDRLIDNESDKDSGKADKLSYWIEDWVKFLDYEPQFSSKSLQNINVVKSSSCILVSILEVRKVVYTML